MPRILPTICTVLMLSATCLAGNIPSDAAAKIGLRPHWGLDLVMPKGQLLDRLMVAEDNAYALTDDNFAFAVHAGTGVLRWTAQISKPGHRVLGPYVHGPFSYFTTQLGVYIYNRQTGRPAEEKRLLSGVIIEVQRDIATINLGRLHGVELGTMLPVYRLERQGGRKGAHIADIRVTVVRERQSLARVTRFSPTVNPDSGDIVEGDVKIPLPVVDLPFAPSSPAIADGDYLYFGGSNNRVYRVRARDGITTWVFGESAPASATPRLHRGNLIVAGQDHRVVSCRTKDKLENWVFTTEGPIFADTWVDDTGVYVASTDRFLYALDTNRGTRRWRVRFNTPDIGKPTVAAGTVFVTVPGDGFYALAADTGKQLWKLAQPAHFLAVDGQTLYLRIGGSMDDSGAGAQSIRSVQMKTGEMLGSLYVGQFPFVGAVSSPVMTIVLADRNGHVECLRSVNAPHLRPEELANLLASDEEARLQFNRKGTAATRPAVGPTAMPEDPFSSKSKTEPLGGHGLVGPGGKAAASAPASQPDSDAGEGEQPVDEAGEGGDKADKGDGENGGEKPDDADSNGSGDDSKTDANSNGSDDSAGGDDKSGGDDDNGGGDDDSNTNGDD